MPNLVVHVFKAKFDLYIGRPNGKIKLPADYDYKWCNHSIMHNNSPAERLRVLMEHEAYLINHPELIADLGELRGKVLGCWCAGREGLSVDDPWTCHGQTLLFHAAQAAHFLAGVPIVLLRDRIGA